MLEAEQEQFSPNPRMVALWRSLIDMERTWRSFTPLPELNKSHFGVMMCIAHGGDPAPVPGVMRDDGDDTPPQQPSATAPGAPGTTKTHAAPAAAPGRQAEANATAHAAHPAPKPVAVGAIAAQMHQSLPGISQKISALEELGYVTRVPDPTDRRVTCVMLTPAGEQKLREGRAHFEAKLNAALDAMGDERMQQLLTLLGELNAALKQTVDPK